MEFTILFLVFYFIFGIFFDFDSLAWCLIVFFVCLLCDFYHVWTVCLFICVSKIRRIYQPKQFMETKTYNTACLLFDVDFNLCLREESLYRKCKLAHAQFFTQNSVNFALVTIAAKMHLRQRYVQYMLPIKVFERFEILTKVIYWDASILYVKQSIVRHSDNFRCAVVYSMFHISGETTKTLLEQINPDTADIKLPMKTELITHLQGLQAEAIDRNGADVNRHKY